MWTLIRLGLSAAILAVLIWQLGVSPFLDGVRMVDGPALAPAAGLGLITTVCCAWRWRIVAGGLGVRLSLPAAVAAYYRSLFLNLTLPGGVVGDVHRGISHGRDLSDVGLALRAVGWERLAGQAVQVVLTVIVLLALPSPVRSQMPLVAAALLVAVIGAVLAARSRAGGGRSALARLGRAAAKDIRDGLLRKWLSIALASAVVVCGHAGTFVIAARTAGITAPLSELLPLALLVMAVMVLPSVAGWGPREGATAWAFAAAGLGAEQGLATAVIYGVIVLAASLPGAAVLVASWSRTMRRERTERGVAVGPAHA